MTEYWVCRIRLENENRAVAVRAVRGIEAASDADFLWLRGDNLTPELKNRLQSIADGELFRVANSDELFPLSKRVPTELIPDLSWSPLVDFCCLQLPVPLFPHGQVQRRSLTLIRSKIERPAELLLTSRPAFAKWGLTAPDVRLRRCRIAVMEPANNTKQAECVVVGTPLPSLVGQRFWLAGQVAVPVGFEWSPTVDQDTMQEIVAKAIDAPVLSDDFVLWRLGCANDSDPGESISLLSGRQLTPATRQIL